MLNRLTKLFIVLFLTIVGTNNLQAQCTLSNNAFQAGESLQYDLYFKYGLLFTKAGWATLTTKDATYSGNNVYRTDLITASTGVARKAFELNDTLTSYISKQMTPLAYFKRAHEGGDFTDEQLYYSYSNNKVNISTRRVKDGRERFNKSMSVDQCTYDMMSVIFFARELNYSSMKKGDKTRISFISGQNRQNMDIVYQGTENMKANNNKTYACHKLSLVTSDDAFENTNEAMKIYITADNNRIPVRIDSGLKIGSMRVVLKKIKGNKHPIN